MSEPKTIVNIVPTFLLRGIRPATVIENYRNGKYADLSISSLISNKINLSAVSTASLVSYGHTPESDVYTYRNASNNQQVIATTNHQAYSFFNKSGGHLPMGGHCYWCHRNYNQESVGIPIKMEVQYIQVPPTTDGPPHYEKQLIYYCDQCSYCSFECCLAGLKREHRIIEMSRNPFYFNSEQLLRGMHARVYPEAKPLIEANHFTLLKSNTGGFSDFIVPSNLPDQCSVDIDSSV